MNHPLLLFQVFNYSIISFIDSPFFSTMAPATQLSTTLLILCCFQFLTPGSFAAIFNITNTCNYTVWPGLFSGTGTLPLSVTGFALRSGESNVITVPPAWSGRLWGRTLCSNDSAGKFSCVTGDCGSSTVECAGGNSAAPVTLGEFTLNGAGGRDFFDVSFVEGYNLPMIVEPHGGTGDGNCTETGCVVHLNTQCPMVLAVTVGGRSVACKSACEAFGDPKYCCTGFYATPVTCKPSSYSQFFKSACPRAYGYVYDNASSIFSCASTDYTITFCPKPSTSLMGPGKKYAVTEGSHNKGTAVAIPVIICGLLIGCTIRIRLSNQNCDADVTVETRVNETIAHVPQPTVSMVGG